ncbi:MAG TPA: argininosuccinate lyase [Clostridia bacterium]|nr:argininosuccinate lyase [Clostridia bacterium]HQM40002.1 argininosuccinate lyase [Clostridia bacterium]
MDKLWKGRFTKNTDKTADAFNSSISIDSRMYRQDIEGSIAHAKMLGDTQIIPKDNSSEIVKCLKQMLDDINNGKLAIDTSFEDIHSFVEYELIKRIGNTGKMLHTARSRNDQVATDFVMYTKKETIDLISFIKKMIIGLTNHAKKHTATVMPGYTHLQRAQPVTLGHYLMAYAIMFLRDLKKYEKILSDMDKCPLGSAALAGTAYPIDRNMTAKALGFDKPSLNSIDSVADRDFACDVCYVNSLVMMHLSRISEEFILWASWEFKFLEISEEFSTGSSIMPQKKNPDMLELIRGKSARTFSNLNTLLVMLKGLPMAYNKDMQEDKEAVMDSIDTAKSCIDIFTKLLQGIAFLPENMKTAAQKGFINATDCADYLVSKSLPFRDAYKITGEIVNWCMKNDMLLENMPIDIYKIFSPLFEMDIYSYIDIASCVERRNSYGGTSSKSVLSQIEYVEKELNG